MSNFFTVFHVSDGETTKFFKGDIDDCENYIYHLADESYESGKYDMHYFDNGFTRMSKPGAKMFQHSTFAIGGYIHKLWQD